MKETKLIAGCEVNDRLSQEQLYNKYADKMYNVCLIYANDEEDACDILQDGFQPFQDGFHLIVKTNLTLNNKK